MKLIPLSADYELTTFNCGDDDLNQFLLEDAKPSQELRIANTFILEDNGRIAAYFCLLNDKIGRKDITNSRWKKIRDRFPQSKQFSSYPTVKIGRFAVSLDYRGQNIGTMLMTKIKSLLHQEQSGSAFRYITVDAYLSAISFYEKNNFVQLNKKDENEHTRLMFFDMMDVDTQP